MKEITNSIGWAIVRVRKWGTTAQWDMQLMTPASAGDPAMSVEVCGEDGIRQLRDALTEALEWNLP